MKTWKVQAVSVASVLWLAACGGGSDGSESELSAQASSEKAQAMSSNSRGDGDRDDRPEFRSRDALQRLAPRHAGADDLGVVEGFPHARRRHRQDLFARHLHDSSPCLRRTYSTFTPPAFTTSR